MSLPSTFPTFGMIGFESLFDQIDRLSKLKVPNFPPYNVKKIDENHYQISLACAGFCKNEIEVETKGNQLKITGKANSEEQEEYLYQSIAKRAFERTFTLADSVVVNNAQYVNGMLNVMLEHVVSRDTAKKIEVK